MNISPITNYKNLLFKTNLVFASKYHKQSCDTVEISAKNKEFNKVFNEAKKYVMDSVSQEPPLEACVYILDNEIIFQDVGEVGSVDVDDYFVDLKCKNSKNNVIVVHSHPFETKNLVFPVSFPDFETINSLSGVKQIYAIAPNGEYSMIKKTGLGCVSDYTLSKFEKIFDEECYQALNDDDKKDMDKFKMIFESDAPFSVKMKAQNEYEKFIQKESVVESEIRAVHNFWKKYEWDLGIKYETNYSFLEN